MINISFFELKIVKEKSGKYNVPKKIVSATDAFSFVTETIQPECYAEEHLWLLTLDTKCKVTGIFTVSKGTLNSSLVHPREIFKRALLQNAASIIVVHNHPSGDSRPNKKDIEVTKQLKEAGEIINIHLLDHLIIGENNYFSLNEKGLM